jgi:TPP-dependent trihydroxycyclohexane-1,2-dione (THcHDO) dehydratase
MVCGNDCSFIHFGVASEGAIKKPTMAQKFRSQWKKKKKKKKKKKNIKVSSLRKRGTDMGGEYWTVHVPHASAAPAVLAVVEHCALQLPNPVLGHFVNNIG